MSQSRFYMLAIITICFLVFSSESRTVGSLMDCFKKTFNTTYKTGFVSLNTICELKQAANDDVCRKTIVGIQQCLLNNNCNDQLASDQIDIHCWNCWADYMTDSTTVQSFQSDVVQKCNWSNYLSFTTLFLLLALFALN